METITSIRRAFERAVGLESGHTIVYDPSMRNSQAIIHLDNLVSNIAAIRSEIGPSSAICLAVKADGYGHGAIRTAKTAVEAGVEYLAVASADEGLELRRAGVLAPVLLLGIPSPDEIERVVAGHISAVVVSTEQARLFAAAAAKTGIPARLHVKIDTGMGRIGCSEDCAPDLAHVISTTSDLVLDGVCTHLPVADDTDHTFTLNQIDRFRRCIGRIRDTGIDPGIVHAANTAGLEAYPSSRFDMIRTGIAAYGYPQAPGSTLSSKLRPVMELRSKVVFLKKVAAGTALSYGHTYTTQRTTHIATVAAGYADGYRRSLSNCGQVLIRGKRYPVVGTVCMDQFLVDLGSETGIELYDDVTLFGPDMAGPDASEVAKLTNTIPYEITCGISSRVPRVYKSTKPR